MYSTLDILIRTLTVFKNGGDWYLIASLIKTESRTFQRIVANVTEKISHYAYEQLVEKY